MSSEENRLARVARLSLHAVCLLDKQRLATSSGEAWGWTLSGSKYGIPHAFVLKLWFLIAATPAADVTASQLAGAIPYVRHGDSLLTAFDTSGYGVLVDDSTGEPIYSAQVTLGEYPDRRGAVTDRLGRFSVSFDSRTIGLIRLLRIGYARREDSVRLAPQQGYVVVIPLRPQAVQLDDLIVCSTSGHTSTASDQDKPSSMVRVRDALTGLAPAGGATLIAVDRTHRDSSTAIAAAPDSALWLEGGRNRLGPYTLIVRSAGYYEWRVDGVRGVINGRGTLAEPRRLFAWLVPN